MMKTWILPDMNGITHTKQTMLLRSCISQEKPLLHKSLHIARRSVLFQEMKLTICLSEEAVFRKENTEYILSLIRIQTKKKG